MTGAEFKALQSAAGLSVRETATFLGVAPATVQRWRDAPDDRSPIPAWAVERLRARVAELVGPPPERRIP
jgi:DNA-binding transcriptional regulator YiaG